MGDHQSATRLIVTEPIGVVGAITPWNYPLYLIICKVAPAIAAGCTVVLKPSEVTPLNAYILAEVIDEVGLPAGVFNMVIGDGPDGRRRHLRHPDVDMVSFTGSGRAGAMVHKDGAPTPSSASGLELGGKSANIVLDDADPGRRRHGRRVRLLHQLGPDLFGAHPRARARVRASRSSSTPIVAEASLVQARRPQGRRARPLPLARPAVVQGAPGAGARVHPEGHRRGRDAGARRPRAARGLRQGLLREADGLRRRHARHDHRPGGDLRPGAVDHHLRATTTTPCEIANGTIYGLSGGVQSGDLERAKAVARRMRTGQVDINGAAFNTTAPFGGYKQSGNTRERGRWGLEEFLETKSIQLPVTAAPSPDQGKRPGRFGSHGEPVPRAARAQRKGDEPKGRLGVFVPVTTGLTPPATGALQFGANRWKRESSRL